MLRFDFPQLMELSETEVTVRTGIEMYLAGHLEMKDMLENIILQLAMQREGMFKQLVEASSKNPRPIHVTPPPVESFSTWQLIKIILRRCIGRGRIKWRKKK
jgi:small nuclear ribonucleoprotein (snRNP)-like protein